MSNGKPKRGDSISVEEDEEEEEEDEEVPGSPEESSQVNGKKGSKKPETEEEKRKNFLERNRQGMSTEFTVALFIDLKCI